MFLQFSSFPPPLIKPDSRVWHQIFRQIFTFLARVFHLPAGTFAAYFKLFFISWLVHATPDYILRHSFHEGTSIQFFVPQAVDITFADSVIAITSQGIESLQTNRFHLGVRMVHVFPADMVGRLHAGAVNKLEEKPYSRIHGVVQVLTFKMAT